MNVSLPDAMREFVQQRIDSGRYSSVSDYVRDLIRRDQTMIEDEEAWLNQLDASIERGLADVAAGRVIDLDVACAQVLAEIDEMAKKAAGK